MSDNKFILFLFTVIVAVSLVSFALISGKANGRLGASGPCGVVSNVVKTSHFSVPTSSSVTLSAVNGSRAVLEVRWDSSAGSSDVYLGFNGAAVSGDGVRLSSTSAPFRIDCNSRYNGTITAIGAGAANTSGVTILEIQ